MPKEPYEDVVESRRVLMARYASLEAAAVANQKEMGRIAGECSQFKSDVIRLGDEVKTAQQVAQLLGDDFNERDRAYNDQIRTLRKKLRDAGIDPDA